MKDEDYARLYGQSWRSRFNVQPVLGSVQYEGSNNFEKKPPRIVNLRLYRHNLPDKWRTALESAGGAFRKDANKGPRANPNALSIAFKMTAADAGATQFIHDIASLLASLLKA